MAKSRKPPSTEGQHSSDDHTPAAVKRALDLVDNIGATIEDVSERARLDHASYFEDVEEKSKAIGKTVERNQRVSDGQMQALENMLSGVQKWVHGDDD